MNQTWEAAKSHHVNMQDDADKAEKIKDAAYLANIKATSEMNAAKQANRKLKREADKEKKRLGKDLNMKSEAKEQMEKEYTVKINASEAALAAAISKREGT